MRIFFKFTLLKYKIKSFKISIFQFDVIPTIFEIFRAYFIHKFPFFPINFSMLCILGSFTEMHDNLGTAL